MINCPQCGSKENGVTDTRATNGGTNCRRRRECSACQFRFTTIEIYHDEELVIKKDYNLRLMNRIGALIMDMK